MLNRITLYWDSFSRLSLQQQYHWFQGRMLKKIIPSLRLNPDSVKKTTVQSDYAFDLKERLHKTLQLQNSKLPLWESGLEEKVEVNDYFNSIKSDLAHIVDNHDMDKLNSIWKASNDYELSNNYQRFYLFDYYFKEKPDDSDWIFTVINSWIDHNPLLVGNAWETFNCAIRLLNWIKLFYNIPLEQFPDKDKWQTILHSIHIQAALVRNNLSYDISGNHLILELVSIWLVDIIFGCFENSKDNLVFVEANILKELDAQITDCGFHYEHSLHYHVQVALTAVIWYHMMKNNGKMVEHGIKNKILLACDVVSDFILPDGSIPQLSDCCYTFFHRSIIGDVENLTALYKQISQEKLSDIKKYDIKSQPEYIVTAIGSDKLIIDTGTIGYSRNPGHGHSDMFSFIYCSNGATLFTDPGTKSYNNDAESLRYKKSEYHNTLTVNSSDQANLWGYFRWANLPDRPRLITLSRSGNKVVFQGEYQAFKNMGGVTHNRTFKMSQGVLEIIDRISGTSIEKVTISFIADSLIDIKIIDDNTVLLHKKKAKWLLDCKCSLNSIINKEKIDLYPAYGSKSISSQKINIQLNVISVDFLEINTIIRQV